MRHADCELCLQIRREKIPADFFETFLHLCIDTVPGDVKESIFAARSTELRRDCGVIFRRRQKSTNVHNRKPKIVHVLSLTLAALYDVAGWWCLLRKISK